MPKSIFSTFKGLHKNGTPLDLLATWRKTFDKASEREVALFQKMYTDGWFTYNEPQMSLTAEAIVGRYNIRFMATLVGDESPHRYAVPMALTSGQRKFPVSATHS